MLEKRFYAVPPQLFTANGTNEGVVTIAGGAATLFKVGMKVYINATGLPTLYLQIKEIDSETNIQVGPIPGTLKTPGANTGITARSNISAYTVALGANISADEQKRPAIDYAEIMRAVYDEEPTVALRTVLVDELGDRYNPANPLPVAFDGTVEIGDVSIVEGGNTMIVNPDGSINVNEKSVGLFTLPYDSINATTPSATVENYQSYLGGLSGTPVQLVVVTYTDSTKKVLASVVRTPTGP
jgi:hypothetical protein